MSTFGKRSLCSMSMLRDARKRAYGLSPVLMNNPPPPSHSVNGDFHAPPAGLAPMLLEALALCGYGLWTLLGLALALGIYRTGRGEALVPLTLGCVFVSAGLLAGCLRLRAMPEWHGWRVGTTQRPTREALLALACYLPMLGLAGLVRGDEGFWATRLASLVLMICSLSCLVTSAYGYRTRRLASWAGVAVQLPVSRLLSAWYIGGLWLWVCVIFQAHFSGETVQPLPWAIGLLLIAMLLGLVDGLNWQSLSEPALGEYRRAVQGLQSRRFLAAIFIWVVPSLSLLLMPMIPGGRWLAFFAATACIVGKSLELWLYDFALTRSAQARSAPVESFWPRDPY
jgi:sulfite dehydrogenase (quinone) subunit SoeC